MFFNISDLFSFIGYHFDILNNKLFNFIYLRTNNIKFLKNEADITFIYDKIIKYEIEMTSTQNKLK